MGIRTGTLLGKPNKLQGIDLRRTSIPSSRFMLQKPGISSGSYDPVGFKASKKKKKKKKNVQLGLALRILQFEVL